MTGRMWFWKRSKPAWMAQNPDRIAWLALLALGTVFLLWLVIQQSHWSLAEQPDTTNWPPGLEVRELADAPN